MRHPIDATVEAVLAVIARSLTPARRDGGGLEAPDRFAGTLRFSAREGSPRDLRVDVHQWSIPGGQRVAPPASPGFRVVQLLAGAVTTIADGRRVAWRQGEFWTVPAGTTMELQTADDAAVLQVTTIR
jgi:quercetin dioxygenase-like cupin family protein